jgi:GntR family histidine utilization transcriptional repressor
MTGMSSPKAPYAQVKDYLRSELERGRWAAGELMPSEAELTSQFGVSRMTVNRALRELQSAGLVNRLQGVGTFAAHIDRVSTSLTIRDIHQEILDRGHHHTAVVHLVRAEKVDDALAARFNLAPGAQVFHSQIVHLENGVPLQYEDRYVNPECAPGYLEVDFTRVTPTHYLLEVAPQWEAKFWLEAHAASAHEARLLKLAKGEPCLVLNRMTSNRGKPITLARLVHPGGRYQIAGQFQP